MVRLESVSCKCTCLEGYSAVAGGRHTEARISRLLCHSFVEEYREDDLNDETEENRSVTSGAFGLFHYKHIDVSYSVN